MIHHFFILLLYLSKCSSDNAEVGSQNHLKIVQAGDSVNFTCIFKRESSTSVVWIKQRVGEKPFKIVSSFRGLDVIFENGFDKHKRFVVAKDEKSFNLSITNTEESDTATYYCVIYVYNFQLGESTDLIVKDGQLSMNSKPERPATDPERPEESAAALQCAVVTQSCAGEHNVYWFRHESGQSPPGIIYTQQRRNGQCESSSDGNSTTHKCVYNLPKNNLSHYEDGIYYCAVAACGEILFGDGRTVDSADTAWNTISLILVTSNCLSVIVMIILGSQLYKHRRKDRTQNIRVGHLMDEDRDALNYAALSFQQNSSTSRRTREST